MDWLGWLHWKYGHDHWCLTVDADELLVYPHSDTRDLRALTGWLDDQGLPSFGAMMPSTGSLRGWEASAL